MPMTLPVFSVSTPLAKPLQYLTLTSVPATGSLYYNYYNTSKYGSAQMPLTASTAGNVVFSYSPASASEYDLSELTYIPSGSNYCTALTFTGYSSSGTAVSATILISVTASPVSEVYSVTTKGTSVNFPANSVYSAVASATGFGLSSIQLLELPASTAGCSVRLAPMRRIPPALTATAATLIP